MKVLFATDGSEYATNAARFLTRIKPPNPIQLTVLTVTYCPEHPDAASSRTWFPEWKKLEQTRIEAHYRELDNLLRKSCESVHMLQTDGNPTQVILNTAREIEADLLVIGACGHSALERILLGSVSDAVATHASCSVLVVRPSKHPSPVADVESSGTSVVLAFDGSRGSTAAAEELNALHWDERDLVTVLSVAAKLDYFGKEYSLLVQLEDEHERLKIENDRVISEHLDAVSRKQQEISEGSHVGETIVKHAEEHQADMIVLGDNGHSRITELLLGSTTKYVLRHASCSVWISRHQHSEPNG